MEDDSELELQLGLSCGNSSTTLRATKRSSLETRAKEFDRGCKQINDFRNFLHSKTAKSDFVKHDEDNFFDDLSDPSNINADASTNSNDGMFWTNVNNNKSFEADQRKRSLQLFIGNSMHVFDEITQVKKKHNREFEMNKIYHIGTKNTVDHHQAIEPGIAGDVKFFGSSSSVPDLPWVSTKGSERTISGVTYRVNVTQVRIVCACHGWHMSPQEFVMHASETEHQTMQENASAAIDFFRNH